MAFFKKIAQDPDEGPGRTEDCSACASDPGFVTSPAIGDAPAQRIKCPWCDGTTKVHKR